MSGSDPAEKELLSQVQDEFISQIMTKNSWGKNEVIELWKNCLLKILMEKIS